ncbi:MAG TPA: four helix bundle protein [Bacteroidia bacterium]
MHNLQELKIWHKAVDLAVEVYHLTSDFPIEEKYGLTSQIKRASVSISSNISEGAGRNSDNEFIHFLGVSNGSAYELQSQLIISNKLNLVSTGVLDQLLAQPEEIQKMNYALQNTLKNKKVSSLI